MRSFGRRLLPRPARQLDCRVHCAARRVLSSMSYPLFNATVVWVREGPEEVRMLRMRVGSAADQAARGRPSAQIAFTFKAGQWIDFCIPDVAQIGGYTITSCMGLPADLAERQRSADSHLEFDLAVKRSRHPPVSRACSFSASLRVRSSSQLIPRPCRPRGSTARLAVPGRASRCVSAVRSRWNRSFVRAGEGQSCRVGASSFWLGAWASTHCMRCCCRLGESEEEREARAAGEKMIRGFSCSCA